MQDLDEELWVTNLDGDEPKSNIIVFLKTSLLTKADKERLLEMKKRKISEKDCASIDSEEENPFG